MSSARAHPPGTLLELLTAAVPSATALASVDRSALSYGRLIEQVRSAASWLREEGVGPGAATAIVLPNGPELAGAFLSAAVAGISAPLNPAYQRPEFAFYLEDLQARVLLIAEGLDSPARDVARERGIRIVELGLPAGAPAGIFTLDGRMPTGGPPLQPRPDDTALVLHTSGTTSRPKMVPLSHANLIASAAAVAETLRLRADDRCLNVMPLFHIHGLVAAVLGSLTAGGSVVCTPGFLAPRFFRWIEQCNPTWYTAVPTIHQAILSRATDTDNQKILRHSRIRFARSSSAAMPRRVMEALETALGVPIVEAYGMTEAAHQMASNPLPPGVAKPGSVGPSAGSEIAVMDASGAVLAPGQTGEVVIRGPGVTAGYRNNPEANARAFSGGWLRTGDEGVLDSEGYLTLTGRIKEQINRAGEKISPLEVDQVLTEHPAVAQALCFGVSHPVLGEDIAAAVVLQPGAAVTERELREYVAGRLAYYKVPRRVVQVDAIPTGPTGKLQRLGLAERLHVTADVPVDDLDLTPPRTPVEEIVSAAWEDVMGRPPPGVRRNFFALGGDSILATRLLARLRQQLAIELTHLELFDAPSVEGIAKAVEALLGDETEPAPAVQPPPVGELPATPTERIVALVWEEVLGISGVRRGDGFFDLGGHSLLAVRVASRLRGRFGIAVSIRTMMEYDALEPLAREVDRLVAMRAGTQGAPRPAPEVPAPVVGESNGPTKRGDPHFAPVTPEQRLLWEIERASPGTPAYNLPICRRIEGPLDLHVLAAALADLAARHDAFRTSIEEDSVARAQRIAASVDLPTEVLDFRHLVPAEAERAAWTALEDRIALPFDLTRAPLCRVTVARLADQDTLLLLTMHHLICDGWSAELILNQLARAYTARAAGQAPALEESGRDFGDHAVWLASPERAAARRQHLEYWRTLLDDADLSVDLPSDHPRPFQPTFEGHRQRVVLPNALLAELDRRAREHETTLNVLLLANFRILLYRLGHQEDLTFGTVLAGRDSLEVERTIGYFARTVLVRTRVTETTTMSQLVRDVRSSILDALDHPASLEDVVSVMGRPMDWAFRLLFSFNEDYRSEPRLGAAKMSPVPIGTPGAKVDLGLAVSRRAEGLEVVLTTRAAQYESSTTSQLLHIYQTLLEGVARGDEGPVSRLSLFRDGERERVLGLAAGPVRPTRAARPLGDLFLEEAAKHPERIALISNGASWTFGVLAEQAGRLAIDIARRGIGPGDVVAIISSRTPEMVMAMVAVVLAGAAYLPLDSEQPAERIRGMLEDAGVKLVLADAAGAAAAENRAPVLRLDAVQAALAVSDPGLRRPRPEDPVYVMFTSGSTGRPKGVVVPHRALVNHMDWALDAFPIEATDVVLQRTPLGFDASIWEVWGPLLAGCPMVLADPDRDFDPHYIGEAIRAQGITTLQLVPSLLNLLLELDGLADCPTLRRVLSGGERLPAELAQRFHAAHAADLVNLYGPTEVTIDATSWRSHPGFSGRSIPIGRPIPNVSAYVLDANREPRPLGIPGELYLGGLGVALGYINRPDLTAERFLPDPFGPAGSRMYRTGDRALLRPDGTLEYLGRVDEQLKLHGFRIEPGEVESVLNARSEVRECAVGVAGGETDAARLMAWVVLHPGATRSAAALREELRRTLPRSLVPSGIIFLDELPKMPSGKINRRALLAPRSESLPFEPPRTPTEQRVAEVWMAVLARDRIGRDDDLFALGGHSLTAIRIAYQLRGPEADLSLRTILEHPTVALLAAELDRQVGLAPGSNATIPRLPRVPRAPRPGTTPLPPPAR